MSNLIESRAESIKLARVLYQDDDSLEFLDGRPAEDIRAFRESVSDQLFDEHRSGFAKLAKLSSLLPTGIAATLAQKALGATLAGRVTGEFTPSKAVAIAGKLPSEFLASVTLNLEPRQAAPVVRAMPDKIVVAVTLELLKREEYISMARFIDVLSDDTVAHVMDEIDDDAAMLRIGFFAENKERLDQVVRLLSEEQLRSSIQTAADQDLWVEALGLAGHVKPDLKAQMIEILLEQDQSVLEKLIGIISEQGLWAGLLPALPRLSDANFEKLSSLESLPNAEITQELLRIAAIQDSWDDLLSVTAHLSNRQAESAAAAALAAPKKTQKSLLLAAVNGACSPAVIDLIAGLSDDSQHSLAKSASELLSRKDSSKLLEIASAAEAAKPFCDTLEQAG